VVVQEEEEVVKVVAVALPGVVKAVVPLKVSFK
jgi:hypothetical protein